MIEIRITQLNYDGMGTNRISKLWVKRSEVEVTIRRKMQAYNMNNTNIEVMEK